MPRLLRLSIPTRPRRSFLLGLFMSCLFASPSQAGWVTQKPFVTEGSLVWLAALRFSKHHNAMQRVPTQSASHPTA